MKRRAAVDPPPGKRRGRGRPIGDRDGKIGELLQAAREVIAREGCARASLRKVADRAGHSTGAITYYFADRDELLAKLVENLFVDFDRWLEPAGSATTDVRAMLERMLLPRGARDAERQIARQVWLQLLVQAGTDAKLAAVIERSYSRFRARLTARIAAAQDEGLLRRDFGADLLADQLGALGDGWLMMQPVERTRFNSQRVRRLIDMAMKLLEPVG